MQHGMVSLEYPRVCLPLVVRMPIPRFNTIRQPRLSSSAQAVHHSSTIAASRIPAKIDATTSLPIREVSTHSSASTPPLPAHYDHRSSPPTTLIASHPHSNNSGGRSSPAKALAAMNLIAPDDDMLCYFCMNYYSG